MWSQGERVSAPCFQLSSPPSRDDSRLCYLLSLGAHLPSRSGCCFGRSSTSSGHAGASEQTAYSTSRLIAAAVRSYTREQEHMADGAQSARQTRISIRTSTTCGHAPSFIGGRRCLAALLG